MKRNRKSVKHVGRPNPSTSRSRSAATRMRIVSGELRGRKIFYNGDPKTRPMKERTREAVFSLLGGHLDGFWCLDLFGGTGILTLESVSRGAIGGLILELAKGAVSSMIDNIKQLQIEDKIQIKQVDTLRWLKNAGRHIDQCPDAPWIVFCCPPYAMWPRESEILLGGLRELHRSSPEGSYFVCETDSQFDVNKAIPEFEWDVRHYPPAIINICQKTSL